jgi:hypothetical protein
LRVEAKRRATAVRNAWGKFTVMLRGIEHAAAGIADTSQYLFINNHYTRNVVEQGFQAASRTVLRGFPVTSITGCNGRWGMGLREPLRSLLPSAAMLTRDCGQLAVCRHPGNCPDSSPAYCLPNWQGCNLSVGEM